MADNSHLAWPFFEERHRELAARLEDWCDEWIHDAEPSDPDAACRALVSEYGRAGFLKLCVSNGEARPAGCGTRCPRSTCARCASPARRSRG